MGDAFNDYSVPYHLTTREFNERVRAWMADDGLYLVNMIDGLRRDFLRAYIHTLQQTLRARLRHPGQPGMARSPRMTYVLVATDSPLDVEALKALDVGDSAGWPQQLLTAGRGGGLARRRHAVDPDAIATRRWINCWPRWRAMRP